jgi:hypothetical protein
MIGIESGKILVIEEMAERAMSDVMEKPGQTKEFLQIGERGKFCFEDPRKRGINLLRESPRDMHGPEGVLKTSMLGRGKYPTGALQLEDATKALNPGGIDHIPFCSLPFDPVRHHNIMINGVCNQSGSVGDLRLLHVLETLFHGSLSEGLLPFSLFSG